MGKKGGFGGGRGSCSFGKVRSVKRKAICEDVIAIG